jgi:hypothetical protein
VVTGNAEYKIGSRVRVELHSGEIIFAEVKGIEDEPSGRKVEIVFWGITTSITPEQITQVLS